MQIHMTLAVTEPPAGTVRRISDPRVPIHVQESEEIAFAGWLGMLQALSDLIGSPVDPPEGAE